MALGPEGNLRELLDEVVICQEELREVRWHLDDVFAAPGPRQVLILRLTQADVDCVAELVKQGFCLFESHVLDLLAWQVRDHIRAAVLAHQF